MVLCGLHVFCRFAEWCGLVWGFKHVCASGLLCACRLMWDCVGLQTCVLFVFADWFGLEDTCGLVWAFRHMLSCRILWACVGLQTAVGLQIFVVLFGLEGFSGLADRFGLTD